MRLLFISNVFPNPAHPIRGIFNLELAAALARQHELRVISPISWVDEYRTTGAIARAVGPDRCTFLRSIEVHHPRYYYPPKVLRSRYGWFLWRSVRDTIERLLFAHPPDAVLGYWAHPDGEAAIRAARLAHVPGIIMVGGSDFLLLARGGRRRERILDVLHAADAVVAVSQDLKGKLLESGIAADKVHVVSRGVDSMLFSPGNRTQARARLGVSDDKPMLLWVGRMVTVKGLDILLDACEVLAQRETVFRFYLVGDGPLREPLMAETVKRNLTQHVRFVGARSHAELADWYRAADWTVLPSRSEGVPNVLRESLACGTPFIASDVGGISEIAEGAANRLVPPGNPLALADAISEALSESRDGLPTALRPPTWDDSAAALLAVVQPLVGALRRTLVSAAPTLEALYPLYQFSKPVGPRQLLRKAMAATLPRRMFLVHGPVNSRGICLTFDDGPHPEHTPRLLDVLRDLGIAATFFVLGRQADRFPNLIRRMVIEGHVVGNHSFFHGEPYLTSARELVKEAQRAAALLGELLGEEPTLFRPPKGKLTAGKLLALWRAWQTVVLWNTDPRDYACRSAEELAAWFHLHPLRGGDVVLLHDTLPYAAEVLPAVIRKAHDHGLKFCTIPEWTKGLTPGTRIPA